MVRLTRLRLAVYAHVRAHRGLYFFALAAGLAGLYFGWNAASRMDEDQIVTISRMLSDRGGQTGALSVFLSAQGRWAVLLGWMTLASLTRFAMPVPPAILFMQSFACGLTLHALTLARIGLAMAVAMLAAYGIMIVLTLPVLMTGAVLSMRHAAGGPFPARGRSGYVGTRLPALIRNMIFLFVCGVPASCARCLLGLLL